MKKLVVKFLLFVLWLVIVVFIGMSVPRILPHQNLHFALIDKHENLQRIDSPRIVLVGGSNLSFGIDSRQMEAAFNKPVLNTSIHAGMGLKYIIEDVLPYIKNGDIVIVSAEYDHFFGGALWGYEPMVSSIFANPSNYSLFNGANWKEMVSAVPKEALRNIAKFFLVYYKRILGEESIGIYDRDSFNAYGDVTTHYNKIPEEFPSNDIDDNFNPQAIDILFKFKTVVENKKGKFFIAFPALNKSSCKIYPGKISLVEKALAGNKLQTLGTPEKYCFEDSLYYNAKYHLTLQGVKKRTTLLIEDLKRVLQ